MITNGILNKIISHFLIRNLNGQKAVSPYIQIAKRKKGVNLFFLNQQNYTSRVREKLGHSQVKEFLCVIEVKLVQI